MPENPGGDWHIGRWLLIAFASALIGLFFEAIGLRGFIGTFASVFTQKAAEGVIERNVPPPARKPEATLEQDQRRREVERLTAERQRAADEAERRLREVEQAAAEERRRAAEADRRRMEIEAEQNRQHQEAARRQHEADERRSAEDARYFTFKICNGTPVVVAVAVEYFSPPDRDRVVKGWMRLQPGNCSTPERFLKGDFSFFAAEHRGTREWRGSSPICVEFGSFKRVRGGTHQCAPNALKYFTIKHVTDPEWNVRLNWQ